MALNASLMAYRLRDAVAKSRSAPPVDLPTVRLHLHCPKHALFVLTFNIASR